MSCCHRLQTACGDSCQPLESLAAANKYFYLFWYGRAHRGMCFVVCFIKLATGPCFAWYSCWVCKPKLTRHWRTPPWQATLKKAVFIVPSRFFVIHRVVWDTNSSRLGNSSCTSPARKASSKTPFIATASQRAEVAMVSNIRTQSMDSTTSGG